jgi:hypothetical protein
MATLHSQIWTAPVIGNGELGNWGNKDKPWSDDESGGVGCERLLLCERLKPHSQVNNMTPTVVGPKFEDLPNFRRQFVKSFLFGPTFVVGVIFGKPLLSRTDPRLQD